MVTLAALAALPLVSPLVQIWLLAQKSKEEIEDIVRMKEPLQVCSASKLLHYSSPTVKEDLRSWVLWQSGKIRTSAS